MAPRITTEHLGSIPPHSRHAVTTHLPEWKYALSMMKKDRVWMSTIKSMYPRMMLHKDIKELVGKITAHIDVQGQNCLLFFAPECATACVEYATSPDRKENAVPADQISIRVFDIDVRLYGVLFPMEKTMFVMPYWMNAGVGISSRLAEESLKHIELLHEVTDGSEAPKYELCAAHGVLKERIAGLVNRATVGPKRDVQVGEKDVYLFQTGMSAIYTLHTYLLTLHDSGAKTVLFGFAFHATPHVFEDFGPGCKFLAKGDSTELDELESYLKIETEGGRKIQAIWTEFPSNPLATVPDLARLRLLADTYETLLIVDDTVASFCNVDLLSVADIVVSSLSKSFNGFANLLAASVVLNPSSKHYASLKKIFGEKYHNDFYNLDAEVLEVNSRDYLLRSQRLNDNAAALAAYLTPLTADPNSSVKQVHYTSTNASYSLYKPYMRAPTPDFTPGGGCLMSIEFVDMPALIAFSENVNVHISPHLGAHLTLAVPYVKVLYGMELEKVRAAGLRETQMRVSVGLEETEELVKTFREAVEIADRAMGGVVQD